jgi:hypothetical protein
MRRQASYGFETVPEGWVETRAGYRYLASGVEIIMHGRHGRWGAVSPEGQTLVRNRLTPEAVLAKLKEQGRVP